MPQLFFIRHGQTEANVKGILTGRLETNLTQKEIDDAIALSKELTEDLDYYYCSPLTRTHQTLKAIKGDVDFIVDDRITEVSSEDWQGKLKSELPKGLETLVGERGVKLSARQKQRLNLIRGILIDKDLYFFDEPTSNLDVESEKKITNMIDKYLKDKTYIIVTHRPQLKRLCNRHYVFEHHMMKEAINV